jgi:hypothetical protein
MASRPPIARRPSWRIQAIGPSADSNAAIEPEVSVISATCGAFDRRAHLSRDPPWVRGDRPAGCALCVSAGVGAAVEALAQDALVGPAPARILAWASR